MSATIEVRGLRVNNLKGITLSIPRDRFIVVSGVSGSGKSSLAFDTLYAEGQRRYVESLSSYARQFLARMGKPDSDSITGLPPAIAIQQKVIARNPRSTVGTATEIYDYLRLLFSRVGHTFSPISGIEVKCHTTEDVMAYIGEHEVGSSVIVLAPIATTTPLDKFLAMKSQEGYNRVYFGDSFSRIDDFLTAHLNDIRDIDATSVSIVIDRLRIADDKDYQSRLYDTIDTAFYEGHGIIYVLFPDSDNELATFSVRFEADGITFEKPTDNMFAFNSPAGACPMCDGYGTVMGIDEKLVVPNPSLSVYDDCVQCWHGEKMKEWKNQFCRRAAKDNFPIFTPYHALTKEQRGYLWHGLPCEAHKPLNSRVCIDAFFHDLEQQQHKIQNRIILSRFRGHTTCPACAGTRVKKEVGYVRIAGKTLQDIVTMPVAELAEWFNSLVLPPHEAAVAARPLIEIRSRLSFLLDVGLGYLTLNRAANTLSGGESQRIRLTTSLGSALVGSMYILDEPSIGLHSRDTQRLIHTLQALREAGNTVVVVEHDEEIIRAADHLIDIGPLAGTLGGEVVCQGEMATLLSTDRAELLQRYPHSQTIRYLLHEDAIAVPTARRSWNRAITLHACFMNNLKGIEVTIPLNILTVITGVSGSGKSSLLKGILYPAVKRYLGEVCDAPGDYGGIDGIRHIRHVVLIDQTAIGRSTRSNPATYLKAYDAIRTVFSNQQLAQQMGFTPQYFSFNADGGRCEACGGAGTITVEMQFMADLELLCEACQGRRFKQEILEVEYEGKNICDVLDMTVDEAITFFHDHQQKAVVERLQPLKDVGLGYIKLGQSSSTLSGGENQRVKLAYYLAQEKPEPTLFIFDEPTIGLHFYDIQKLLAAFTALINRGHSVVVVEHNLEVIKCADYIIDLGPEGGDKGGEIVCQGTPEEIVTCDRSITAQYLKDKL